MIKCGLGTCAWSLLLPAQPPALSAPTPQPGQVSDHPPEIMCCRASEAEMSWEFIMFVANPGSSRRDVSGNVVTKGRQAVYLPHTQPG